MDLAVKYATIIVKDMDESIKFYTETMGFAIDSQYHPQPGTTITLMKGKGEAMIELIQSAAYDVGFYSVGMEVENLLTAIAELKSKGAKMISEPLPTLVGSLAFLQDPNGVTIALIQHD